jgi:beta-glucosidase
VFASQNDNDIEKKIDDLIKKMSLKEKIMMLHGKGFYVPGNKKFKIPPLKMSDGPAGVRWGKATAFPAPIAFAATWDISLVKRVGKIMAEELKAYGRNVFLAPCINIHRIPVGSRNFESYGEDPFLIGKIAASFIKGVQGENVITCVKHFTANNQEWNRTKIDVIVSERALREIYLPAFKMAVEDGKVWCVMSAYNKVNGDYCSENKHLLTDILKNEWGFKGFVVSDWGATHSTVKSAESGLDIEMPFGRFFGYKLKDAVRTGKISEHIINEKIRRILRAMLKTGVFSSSDAEKSRSEIFAIINKHGDFAKEVAENSIVLLKNRDNLLPLNTNNIKSIAIIGPNAKYARTGGGGSAMVKPFYSISPIKGVLDIVDDKTDVYYAPGINIKGDIIPVDSKYLKSYGENGLYGEYFKNGTLKGEPALKLVDKEIYFNWSYDLPDPSLGKGDDSNEFSVRWEGELLPPVSGNYKLKFLCDGGIRVYINDKLVLEKWKEPQKTMEISLKTVDYDFKDGEKYNIKIEYSASWSISEFKFGWDIPGRDMIKEAVSIAKKSDIVLLFLGLSPHFETESRDRDSMEIPNQNRLVEEIYKTNPKTIVILMNGTPLNINKWVDKVPAIIEAWYPGQEDGRAIASVLFGKFNPSGKLPFSWYKKPEDCLGFKGYKDKTLKAVYYDDIFVGYRYLDKNSIEPLFPFGYGLSYTDFQYSDIKTVMQKDKIIISFKIKNTGKYYGGEVAQIYVAPPKSNIKRAVKELKGFEKVFLSPNEEKQIIIEIMIDSLGYYDVKTKKRIIQKGEYKILVGSSSRDIRLEGKINL